MSGSVQLIAVDVALGTISPAQLTMSVLYLASAGACLWALWVARIGMKMSFDYKGAERRANSRVGAYRASMGFWALLAVVFVFLGISRGNSPTAPNPSTGVPDLSGLPVDYGLLGSPLFAAIAILGAASLAALLYRTRHLLPRHALAFVGSAWLASFLVVRAFTMHNGEHVLNQAIVGVTLGSLLEFVGALCVVTCAIMNSWWIRPLIVQEGRTGGHVIVSLP